MVRSHLGGDATVRGNDRFRCDPAATELCFADRFSAAAPSDVATILKLADGTMALPIPSRFLRRHMLLPPGSKPVHRPAGGMGRLDADIHAAQARFWPVPGDQRIAAFLRIHSGMVMARLSALFEFAGEGRMSLLLLNVPARPPPRCHAEPSAHRSAPCATDSFEGNGLSVQAELQAWRVGAAPERQGPDLAVFRVS